MKTFFKGHSPICFIFIALCYLACKNDQPVVRQSPVTLASLKKAQLYSVQADTYYAKQVYDSAFYCYSNAKILFANQKDSVRAAYNLLMMARIQRVTSDYYGSESSITEALSYLPVKEKAYRREAYNILGMCYRKLFNYEEAVKAYTNAMHITSDLQSRYIIKNNIAMTYYDQGKTVKALEILQGLQISKDIKRDTHTYARILNNLGLCYTDIRNPEAISLLEESLSLRRTLNDNVALLSSYLALAKYYTGKNEMRTRSYAALALQLSIHVKSPDDRLTAIKYLIKANTGERANKYMSYYITLNDSLQNSRTAAKNQFAKIRYDTKVIQLENLKLKSQKQIIQLESDRNENQKIVLGILVIFIMVVAYLLFKLVRARHKKITLYEIYKTETRISKQVHDEIANDVFHIMSFTEHQDLTLESNRDKVLGGLETIYGKARSISRNTSDIDTGPEFTKNLKSLLYEFNTAGNNIIINGLDTIRWPDVDEVKKINIYRILQELMVNMMKHSQATLVVITFNQADQTITIKYADNGKGTELNILKSRNGLQNVETRNEAIGGKLTFESEPGKGFKIHITFPV